MAVSPARVDPLVAHLFTPTTDPRLTSALPQRAPGTRSRAGNAMGRTRSALIDGARRAVEVRGTKISMAQLATSAGVAKATLSYRFRTRDDVLSALLTADVDRLVEDCAELELVDALAL